MHDSAPLPSTSKRVIPVKLGEGVELTPQELDDWRLARDVAALVRGERIATIGGGLHPAQMTDCGRKIYARKP